MNAGASKFGGLKSVKDATVKINRINAPASTSDGKV